MKASKIDRENINSAQRFVCHIGPVVAALKLLDYDLEYSFEDDDSEQKIAEFTSWLESELANHQTVLDKAQDICSIDNAVTANTEKLAVVKDKIFLHQRAIDSLSNLQGCNLELLIHRGFSCFEIAAIMPDQDAQYLPHFDAMKALKVEQEEIERLIAAGSEGGNLPFNPI